jgi:DNA polymerase-3 subunit beta
VLAVAAAPFSSFVSNTGSARSVSLETKEGKLLVTTPSVQARINVMSPDDFPTIPKAEGNHFSINPRAFASGFKAVLYAASLGSLKPELGSVFVSSGNDELIYAATDSFRLAEKKIHLKNGPNFSSVLVPIKNAAELVRLLEDEGENGDSTVTAEKGQLSVESPRMRVTSRLLEGVFPDYHQIMPKETTTEAVALKEDIVAALRSTTLFSDRFNQVRLSADPEKKLFELSAKNGELGESQATIPAALSGVPIEGNFNHRYISDCLPAIAQDSVSFGWSGEGKPLLIRGVGDGEFRYIVMPMNR